MPDAPRCGPLRPAARARRTPPLHHFPPHFFDCPENRVDADPAYSARRLHAAAPPPAGEWRAARPRDSSMSALNDRLEARLAREWQQRGPFAWGPTPPAGGV